MLLINSVLLILLIAFASSQRNLAENDFCGNDGARGLCKTLNNCQAAKEILQNGGRPRLCGFKGSDPLICCPLGGPSSGSNGGAPGSSGDNSGQLSGTSSSSQPSRFTRKDQNNKLKSISEQKCIEYAKSVFESVTVHVLGADEEKTNNCGWTAEEQIVGGERAKPRVYTHMALIGYKDNDKEAVDWQCGGSLISEKFVLSAAHCSEVTIRNKPYFASWVRLGELDIESDFDDAGPEDIEITKRFVHPSYNKSIFYHDIALFQLASNVQFTKFIRPVCLQNSFDIDTSEFKPVVTGWGRTSFKGYQSADLQQLHVDLVTQDRCKDSFKRYEQGPKSPIPDGIKNATMLCAGGERGKDSCSGDSGGPLQIPLKNPYCMFSQIGVVAFGYQCAVGYPGVYTRVSYYIPWIESIVWPK